MDPDVALSVRLDAICARNRYAQDPGSAVAELREAAGPRLDVLHESVGTWVGFFDDEWTHALCVGLLAAFSEAQEWVGVGRARRGRVHGTDGF